MIEDKVPFYWYRIKPVLNIGNKIVYWDQSMITDQKIINNKADILVIDRTEKCGLSSTLYSHLTKMLPKSCWKK